MKIELECVLSERLPSASSKKAHHSKCVNWPRGEDPASRVYLHNRIYIVPCPEKGDSNGRFSAHAREYLTAFNDLRANLRSCWNDKVLS